MSGCRPIAWKDLDELTLLEAGVWQDADGTVRVPYRLPGGWPFRCKVFSPSGGSYWGPGGKGVLPYGLELLAKPADRYHRLLWLAEGESDALTLREHYAAWRGCPVDVLGVPGACAWRPEWAQHAVGYRAAYVFPDGDGAGERMAEAIGSSVRGAVVVYLPADEDVRGLVQRLGPDELDRQIFEAEQVALLFAAIRLHPTPARAQQWLREVSL